MTVPRMKDSRKRDAPVLKMVGDYAVPVGWLDVENRRTGYDAGYGGDTAHISMAIGTDFLVENDRIVRRAGASASELGCVSIGLEKSDVVEKARLRFLLPAAACFSTSNKTCMRHEAPDEVDNVREEPVI